MNITYIDQAIKDAQIDTVSMHNLYDTILVGDENDDSNIFRIPTNDFFLKYKDELEPIKQLYQIQDTMFYKPKLVSYEIYGTTELWLAILRANNMRNTSEFHYPYINVYNPDSLKKLIKIFFKREGKY